jgi:ADP-ribosylglycohydrolase
MRRADRAGCYRQTYSALGARFDAFNKNVLGPTSKIALAIRDGKPVSELDNNGVTNGAAMRASPLGCLLPADASGTLC